MFLQLYDFHNDIQIHVLLTKLHRTIIKLALMRLPSEEV